MMKNLWWLVFDYAELRTIHDELSRVASDRFKRIVDEYCRNKIHQSITHDKSLGIKKLARMLLFLDGTGGTVCTGCTYQSFTKNNEPCCDDCGTHCHICGDSYFQDEMFKCADCGDEWDTYNDREIEYQICKRCIRICVDCEAQGCSEHAGWVQTSNGVLCSECRPELYQTCKGCGRVEPNDSNWMCCGYCNNCHDKTNCYPYRDRIYPVCKKIWCWGRNTFN